MHNWQLVLEFQDSTSTFVDVDHIQIKEGVPTAWVLTNFAQKQRIEGTDPITEYQSIVELSAFDCEAKKDGWISRALYAERDGQGATVPKDRPAFAPHVEPLSVQRSHFVTQGTVGQAVLEFVCKAARKAS